MTIAALLPALVPALGKVIDRVIPDKDAQSRARAELARMEQEGELRQTEVQISAILAEAQSRDKWTSRARPTFLYVMYGVIILTIVGGIIGIWFPEEVTTAAQNIANLLAAIPESLWWLFGTGYLGYTGARSVDKWRAAK